MRYSILAESLSVCRIVAGGEVPPWATAGEFSCVVRTPDEISIVCAEKEVPAEPEGILVEGGWTALKLQGPFPFAMTGVLASLVQPLADAGIPIFAISTFDTDYVLVKKDSLAQALSALAAAGHRMMDER